ncbi:PREDICTED: RNA polymerase II degradation factor 1 [Habropoda laboriosa]|uniref:RNA polymerase II degradation factor 1 n=1 Tax=Habropoda laboriosa TaxID=597456 RepID=UPI00083CCF73|nr:PREDICTED: RNA polymerase II degradation factor 1 [Habropoda laboriosa]
MAQWISFVLLVVTATIVLPMYTKVSVMLDPYGNPIVFLREKRTAVQPYPHRAMMFTGYYRPVRRSSHGGQATGVFAQGNAVSGEAFFGGMQAPHLKNGPEPIEEPEVSSAEAQAAPAPEDSYNGDEQHQVQQEEEYQPEDQHAQDGHHPQEEPQLPQDEQHNQEEEEPHHHKQHSVFTPQEQPEPVPVFTTVASPVTPPAEESVYTNTEAAVNRPKVHPGKKAKKPPVVVDDDEEDDEEDDDELSIPSFVPLKGNRRRQNYPNLNNFFPMVFSFPGASTRQGSQGGSPPGAVTAIANSYSTGKGGVASSVATAYGGSPNGKKRRTPTSEE